MSFVVGVVVVRCLFLVFMCSLVMLVVLFVVVCIVVVLLLSVFHLYCFFIDCWLSKSVRALNRLPYLRVPYNGIYGFQHVVPM